MGRCSVGDHFKLRDFVKIFVFGMNGLHQMVSDDLFGSGSSNELVSSDDIEPSVWGKSVILLNNVGLFCFGNKGICVCENIVYDIILFRLFICEVGKF